MRAVRFIERPDSPWAVVGGWPFSDHHKGHPSQLLNTVSLEMSLRHAYKENWIATVRVSGYVVCTLMKNEFMEWCGIPPEDFALFQGDPENLAHIFDRSPGEIKEAVEKALKTPSNEYGSDIVAAGTLMSDLGVWPENWRLYFAAHPNGLPSEIFLLFE